MAPTPLPSSHIQTVGLVIKPVAEAQSLINELAEWFTARDCKVLTEESERFKFPAPIKVTSREEIAEHADLILVLGGDGTMISASRLVGRRPTPLLGVNFGYLGYLTEYNADNIFQTLESVFAGKNRIDSRMKLETFVIRDGKEVARDDVINDVVVNKSHLARLIELQCRIDKQFVSTFRADGLIVATPTGSTAYSLSAGGPIIHPTMHAVVMTPICPHTLTNRPLVVSDEADIELHLIATRGEVEDVTLTLDGQAGISLCVGDRIIIRKSPAILRMVEPPDKNYFQVLRDKLKWGGA
ncbi:MAG: NAD(+)/NADH kinase [Blastocatellia bacterium]|nr:NAD(+)/NADH kinase [Blastocatellia bacterium]